ncbi:MAG TPA: guanylate kinase [Gemmatimonadales bacterium]
MKPFLLVLSSPSGGGKTSIARRLLDARDDVGYSVSATTRAPRPGEQEGRDYHFLSRAEFERRAGAGQFLEHAAYGGNLYGTLRSEIERIFAAGRHAVLDIEVEGARQIRTSLPGAVHVFVLPPSGGELVRRLEGRNTEDATAVARRLDRAEHELAAVPEYDYAIVNQDLAQAVRQVSAIIDAEAQRVSRQNGLGDVIAGLRKEIERAKKSH